MLWPMKQYAVGWSQLSWSHWRRFHRRSMQCCRAILPGPRGVPASALTQTFNHTHIQRGSHYTCTFTHIHLKISQIRTFTQRSTVMKPYTPTGTLRHVSLRCTLLIDSTWQSLPAEKQVRSRGKEKYIGVEGGRLK